MSEAPPTPSTTSTTPPASAPAAPRRRWPRRLAWLLALLVIARVALGLAARPLARALAATQGIDLHIERFDLSLLEGRVELWRIEAAVQREQGEPLPLLEVQTLALDVDTAALLGGHLRVRRLELDGAQVELTRDAGGSWNVAPLIARFAGGADEAPPEPYEPRRIPLELPLEVVAARAQNVSVRLNDAASTPALVTTLTVSVSAADVGSPGRRARLDVVATSPESLDLLRVRAGALTEETAAELDLDLELSGLRLRPLAALLLPLGIEPVAERIDGGLGLELRAAPATEPGDRIEASLALRDARLSGDGREALALDSLALDVAEVWPRGARVRELELDGVRGRAERLPDGALALAGIAWRGFPPDAADPGVADDEAPLAAAGDAGRETGDEGGADPDVDTGPDQPGAQPFQWSVDRTRVAGGQVSLEDRALVPTVGVEARLEELAVEALSSSPDAPPAELRLTATVPEIAERIELGGTLRPFAAAPEARLTLDVTGVAPERIAPYLALVGIEPAFEATERPGAVRIESIELASVEGEPRLTVSGLVLEDGTRELAAIDSIRVAPSPDGPPEVDVEGAILEVTRAAGEAVELLGLRFGADPTPPRLAAAPPEPAAAPAPARGARSPFEVPRLELPSARLQLERLRLTDEASGAPPVTLGPLTAVLAPAAGPAAGARAYELDLEGQTDLSSELSSELRLAQRPDGALTLSGRGRARGVELEPLRPWLALAGLEPALEAGAFDGGFELLLEAEDGVPVLDLSVGPLRLAQASGGEEREWLGLERLAIERLRLGEAVEIAAVQVDSPRIALQRDPDGGLRALGLRLPPSGPARDPGAAELISAAEASEPEETPAPSGRAPGGAPDPAAAPVEASAGPERPGWGLSVERVELSGARARFDDLALPTPGTLELEADLGIDRLAPGPGSGPTGIDGRLALGGAELTAQGELLLDPDDWRATLTLSGEGLNGAAIAPYLPPGLAVELGDAMAAGTLDARLASAPEGGHAISLVLEALDLRERGAERPLAALGALRATAPRLDPEGGVLDVEELAVEGAVLDLKRTAGGGIAGLGLRFEPPPETGAEPAGEVSLQEEEAGGERVASAAVPAGADDAGAGTGRVPYVRLGRLDLELAELRVTSEAFPEATPAVGSARLSLREPFELDLDPDAEGESDAPPLALELTAGVSPGIESLDLGIALSPFAERPGLEGSLAVRGISGEGLLALAPELAGQVDPSGLTEGSFDATGGAELSWRRRGPMDFDLSGGFGAELGLLDVAFRTAPEGEIALGVDRVDVAVRRVAPRSGLVHVSRLEVETPRARVRRTGERIELAGLWITLPATPEGDAPTPAEAETARPEPVEPGPIEPEPGQDPDRGAASLAAASAEGSPTPELRIEELLVHGIDVRVEDDTEDPPFVLPLEDLEAEVRGFTTRALSQPAPIRISASLGAGAVTIPKRIENRSLAGGIASGVLSVVSGGDEKVEYEERPLFQDATLTARLQLHPRPEGWIRTSLTAFELTGLRSLARQSGVEVGDGLLDFSARVRLDGQGTARVDSLSSFAYLSLSEPRGGPISRYLKLPAPLDTVLFALKNEQGEHRIPLSFEVSGEGRISAGQVAAEASKTLLALITEALTSAPVRAVGGVTDILVPGVFKGDRKPEHAGKRAMLRFPPGAIRIGPEERSRLDKLVEAMRDDDQLELVGVHFFGPADLRRAERLASPETSEAATLVRSLRLRRDGLIRQRDELAAQARAHLLLGQDEPFESTRGELLELDRELGLTEDGIDTVAELLRPGAENRRERRTREAALGIARARIDALSRTLIEADVPFERVDLRPPRYELVPLPGKADAGGGEQAAEAEAEEAPGRIVLVTRAGTPPKGFFRRILGWVGL